MSIERLAIETLGLRGEGMAAGACGPVFVPYALPGDTILADVDGDRGHLIDLVASRPDRIAPICPYFGTCGGCAVQALPPAPYAEWKRRLVGDVLGKAHLDAEVAPLVDAHGLGRRRATFHVRVQATSNLMAERRLRVGFMRAHAHEVVDIDQCPVLAPGMAGALDAARRLGSLLLYTGKPLDVVATATAAGLDIDLRGVGLLAEPAMRSLSEAAEALDLARLANHGSVIIERRPPAVRFGQASVVIPPGAFLQATVKGEQTLAALVEAGIGPARKVADLFCGLGTFALRLAASATVLAVDVEGPSLSALSRAARQTPALRPVATQGRDLGRRPLTVQELASFDAVVFDPPRAGAQEQAEQLAASAVPVVVGVSCNPATFARDAGILVGGGYRLDSVTPVDQFRYSPHVEVVAVFRKAKPRSRAQRSLFG